MFFPQVQKHPGLILPTRQERLNVLGVLHFERTRDFAQEPNALCHDLWTALQTLPNEHNADARTPSECCKPHLARAGRASSTLVALVCCSSSTENFVQSQTCSAASANSAVALAILAFYSNMTFLNAKTPGARTQTRLRLPQRENKGKSHTCVCNNLLVHRCR